MNQLGFMHSRFGVCMTNIVVAGSHNFKKQEPDSRFILQLQICFRLVCLLLSDRELYFILQILKVTLLSIL